MRCRFVESTGGRLGGSRVVSGRERAGLLIPRLTGIPVHSVEVKADDAVLEPRFGPEDDLAWRRVAEEVIEPEGSTPSA
jgi:hypothetical protein